MKHFEFVECGHYSSRIRRGPRRLPFYTDWMNRLKLSWKDKPRPFTEAEMLKMTAGSSVHKRIASMREGTTIRLTRLHSTASLYLRRMYEDEITTEAAENKHRAALKAIRASIYASIPHKLKDEEKRLVALLKGVIPVIEDYDED